MIWAARCLVAVAAAAVSCGCAISQPAMAQSAAPPSPPQSPWAPGKTVRLVIPFPPGGASDILGRLLAQHISSTSGQGMVIENRPGGGTVIATEVVSRATPDGATLLLMAQSRAALGDAEISAKIIAAGMLPEGKTCGPDFSELLKTQLGRYAKAIKDAEIKER